jgi:predicted SpoU family rRNA methylase
MNPLLEEAMNHMELEMVVAHLHGYGASVKDVLDEITEK